MENDLQGLAQRVTESQQIVRNGQRLLGQVKRHGSIAAAATAPLTGVSTGNPLSMPSGLSSPLLSGKFE